MKTNVQIKDEPIEIPNYSIKTVKELFPEYSICSWCQQLGSKLFPLHTDNGDSKILCSEVCFNQYRRASFKKNQDLKIHQTINCTTLENKSTSKLKSKHHRFQYPLSTPRPIPSRTTSSTNYTCILPSFIPLPIPVPLYFPIHVPCMKCSTHVVNQECQTEILNQQTRRIST